MLSWNMGSMGHLARQQALGIQKHYFGAVWVDSSLGFRKGASLSKRSDRGRDVLTGDRVIWGERVIVMNLSDLQPLCLK